MALQFIFGNSGSGKSHYLYKKITEQAIKNPDKNYLVLVPEQFTMQTQKDLCVAHPRGGIMNIDVLSFGRLAHRVFEECGRDYGRVLDDEGKNLILRKIAGDYENSLKVLRGNLKKQGYISEVKSVISEFTQYGIDFNKLDEFMEVLEPESYLRYKLQDIRKVYEGFESYLADRYITKEELLDVLSETVPESSLLAGSTVVLDGFTGFTPVQNRLLGELFKVCDKVMITTLMDQRENPYVYTHPYQLFGLSKQMTTNLMQIAKENGCEIEEAVTLYEKPLYRFRKNKVLGFLESELFRYTKNQYTQEQEILTINVLRNPKQEAEYTASRVRYFIRVKGYRYRDIGVIASDLSTYAIHLERAFASYGIPIFMDNKKSILQNAFVEYLRSLLVMAEQDFTYESVFRFLRTQMPDFTREEVDLLENYVLATGVKGYKKWQAVWARRSQNMTLEDLELLNVLRSRFVQQQEALMQVLKKRSKTVKEVTLAVYEYLVEQNSQQKLKEREMAFQTKGELALAKEYAQVYRIVIELFEKFIELMGTEKISLKEYCQLLDAGLEEAKVGVIPPSLDQVMVGDVERTRMKDIKALFFLGANDTLLPGKLGQGGLLSERDRARFTEGKIALSPGTKEKTYIQKFYLYMNLTKPTEFLSLSFSKVSSDGKSLRPAYLIQDLKRLFVKLEVKELEEHAVEQVELSSHKVMERIVRGLRDRQFGLDDSWKELYTWFVKSNSQAFKNKILDAAFYQRTAESLNEKTSAQMYGEQERFSVTRLEQFAACAYAHFLKYGLHVTERELYSFEAMDLGNIAHQSMERFSKRIVEENIPWVELPEETCANFIEESVEESIQNYGNTVLYSNARNEYMITRIKKLIHRSVWALTQQLQKGDFLPTDFELKFGSGKIDRIDTCEDEANIYVKVTDYKTGNKSFDIVSFYHGLQLQLPIYLNAAIEMEKKKNQGKEIIPAGLFYYRIKDPIVEKEKNPVILEEKLLRELKLDGLINAEDNVLQHLERELQGTSNYIPVGKNKDGSLSRFSKVLEPEEFELFLQYTKEKEQQLKDQILQGETDARPYELGNETGCDYCLYGSICGFDATLEGCKYKHLEKLSKDELVENMKKTERWMDDMSMKWTEEQQKVIDLRNRNILVSAAAGSGKTAVLVERIIKMLTDTSQPVDVDSLLIVTFTEAAAAEMKERIRAAIESKVEEDPDDVHLQRQATLIHSASITTIHSFCLSVIRDHFHVIDIDPGFRIGEEGELKLLKKDVLDALLEEYYTKGDEDFLDVVEKFTSGKNDKRLEEMILKLYEYSRSYPRPNVWLDTCTENYSSKESIKNCMKRVMEFVHLQVEDMRTILKVAITLCEESDGPYMYGEMLESDLEVVEMLEKSSDYTELFERLQKITWKRLSTKKDESVNQEKREQVKVLREKIKKMTKDINAAYFYEDPEEITQDMISSAKSMHVISDLVKSFGDAFSEQKRNKNLIDFSDMEQFALQILTVEQNDELVPSAVSKEYQEQFIEIMIDEYQDSNLIQEAILTSVSRQSQGVYNVFMVGDVKQSIYRFRLSRPELFMEKYEDYAKNNEHCQRIDLHKNFRSRTEVLDSVNFFFMHIMRRELGGIVYDEQAALYPGADYNTVFDETKTSYHKAELLLIDPKEVQMDEQTVESGIEEVGSEEVAEENSRILEARLIARRIRELLQNGSVTDKVTKKNRLPSYKDIVILTRSMKGWSDIFATVLAEEGIPAYAGSQEGYFETYEIGVLLSYLRILDSFRQEIPLCAVLASPFVGLNTQELAEIRVTYRECPFYEAVQKYAEEFGEKNELSKKLHAFLNDYNKFRERVPYTPIYELLWAIIEETGYGIYVASMPGGAQREANIEMLVEKATAFESTSYKGLFNFIRYIEQLQKYDVDYGEANISDEQSDTVRIMSIHKSKGLEFPIVFVAGMVKRFNTQDTKGSFVIHPEWGVGIDEIDLEKRTKISTLLKKIIQEEITRENLGEELRVLYVALTRAKEKLILTGALPDAKKVLEQYEVQESLLKEVVEKNKIEPLSYHTLSKARTYLDWILPTLPFMTAEVPLTIKTISRFELGISNRIQEKAEQLAKETLLDWGTEEIYHAQLREQLQEQLRYRYPFEQEGKLKFKFTVSELKKRIWLEEEGGTILYEEPEVVPLLPTFMQDEVELSGASRGSAYHKLLELIEFSKEYDEKILVQDICEFQATGKLSSEMVACIYTQDILGFLHSAIGQRMQHASKIGRLRKEQPFVLGVKADEIYSDTKSDETLLVQGIIDVYFEEEDGLVVLDYKTDQVRTGQELKEKYHAQLDYYARALEQLLGKKVKEKIIYSFTLREEVKV